MSRFLLSTHYTKFESHPAFFTLNLTALILVGLAPKLPYFHRLRFKFFDAGTTPGTSHSRSARAGGTERELTVRR